MARTTISTTIERIRRQLSSSYRHEINVLDQTINTSATLLNFTYNLAPNLQAGAILSIGTELMRVMTVNTTNKTATVIRAFHDSEAQTHSAGAEVWVNSRFTGFDIWEALQDEIASYGPQLYQAKSVRLTLSDSQAVIELPAAFIGTYGIIDVNRYGDENTLSANDKVWPRADVRLIRYDNTVWTEYPTSGMLLRIVNPVASGKLLVKAAMPFVQPTAVTQDLVTDCGLPSSLLDVLSMGVRLRLMQDDETGQTARTAQDEPRRAVEVQVGQNVQPTQLSLALYRSRRNDEANKIRSLHPIRYAL